MIRQYAPACEELLCQRLHKKTHTGPGHRAHPLLADAFVAVLGEAVKEAVTELVAGVHPVARRRIDLHLAPGQQPADDLLLRVHLVHEPVPLVPVEAKDAQLLVRPQARHSRQHTCTNAIYLLPSDYTLKGVGHNRVPLVEFTQ